MRKQLLRIMFFVTALVIAVSCSKDDPASDIKINQSGGDISKYQVVTVDVGNTELTEKQYPAILGGLPIVLTKTEEHKLVFMVPDNAKIGLQDLVIASLKDATIHYNVKETVLTESVDNTVQPMLNSLDAFSQTLDNSGESIAVQKTVNSFNAFYSKATDEEKTAIAFFYKANKANIDFILNSSYTGRNFLTSAVAFVDKHREGIKYIAVGLTLVYAAPAIVTAGGAILAVKAAGLAIAAVGGYKSYENVTTASDNVYTSTNTTVGGWYGTTDRKNTAGFTLKDNVSSELSFEISGRKLIESDRNSAQPKMVQFFEDHDQFNEMANSLNGVIEEVNSAKNTEYSPVSSEKLPATSPEVSMPVDQDVFSNMKFSVTHPNLQLVSASLQNGKLQLKVKFKTPPSTTTPVETFLYYSYSDEISSFSGKVPMIVEPNNPLIGTWKLISFENGALPGQYVNIPESTYTNGTCTIGNLQAYTINSQTIVITETTFTNTESQTNKNYNYEFDKNCHVIKDNPDTYDEHTDNETMPYTVSGNNLSVTYNGENGPEIQTVPFTITGNKLSMFGSVFERQ